MVDNPIIHQVSDNSDQPFKYSILIPTWDNPEYLKLCIKTIRQNSSFNHQCIVHIHDGSVGCAFIGVLPEPFNPLRITIKNFSKRFFYSMFNSTII